MYTIVLSYTRSGWWQTFPFRTTNTTPSDSFNSIRKHESYTPFFSPKTLQVIHYHYPFSREIAKSNYRKFYIGNKKDGSRSIKPKYGTSDDLCFVNENPLCYRRRRKPLCTGVWRRESERWALPHPLWRKECRCQTCKASSRQWKCACAWWRFLSG